MRSVIQRTAATTMIGVGIAGAARASEVLVTANITTSTTWTANNTYNLQNQVYVLPGATLTIEAGTIVASDTNIGGSLAVCRGAQIFVNGTKSDPVIMTSKADVATWTGGDPKTGVWREACNEWGNLTIMGAAYVSENAIAGNTPAPNAANYATMEGLTAGGTDVQYGGGNDDDDSGTITYLSLRYGGKVIALANELNGLSLGGIGRGTDLHHIDIMNNVDDGIEIWGGTVGIHHFNIWNIGDDCFDVDQGWRGKAQFGLLVQGYSVAAAQGSGVGDNVFETDGAEQSDYQPVTTSTIYNCTVIGQPTPGAGDHATAWRDNARVQYRNCIFMELGDRLVSADNVDGDGGAGYGNNGTLSFAATWTTPYTATSTVNAPGNPALFYTVQTSGNLAEIKDSVMFNNPSPSAYTEANARGVFAGANNNVLAVNSPIVSITRGPAVNKGGFIMLPVIGLDPRPANDALTSVTSAPNDGFFTSAAYRGAFAPGLGSAWLCDWTASYAFGYTPNASKGVNYCTAGTTTNGCNATMSETGTPSASAGSGFTIAINSVEGAQSGIIFYTLSGAKSDPWGSGTSFLCVKAPFDRTGVQNAGGTVGTCSGVLALDWNLYTSTTVGALGTPFAGGETVWAQGWFRDPPAPKTTNLSDGYTFIVEP